MKDAEIINAIITRVEIGYEDHGIMTAWVFTKHEHGGQGFGGFCLNSHESLGKFITRTIETLKVNGWETLAGKPCRLRIEDGLIRAIGHFLEDSWFEPRKEMA